MNYQTIKTKRKTSLTDNSFLRYITFIALYFAQGVPEGMLSFGIPAWMVMNGKSPGEIAGFAVVTVLPWSFKFIVAPLMDRYNYLPMGRKRPWILLGQIGLLVSCIYLAYIPEPLNNIDQLMIAGFFVSFFGAFQDVATDGMAVDIIPADQQAKANGLMWGSKIIGMSLSLALGSWLLNKYNFTIAILMMAVAIGIIMLVPLFLRERQGEKIVPWTSGEASPLTKNLQIESWRHIFKSLFSVFRLRNSLIIALVLFISQGGFKYVSTLLPIFTVKELSWTNVDYSNYFASAKLVGGIVGMLIGGLLIDKFGKKRMMNFYFLSSIFLIMTLVLSKSYWYSRNFIFAFMITQNILYTFASIGIFAIAMQCCWKKVSTSQFTLFMTIANLGQMTFAALIGPIRENFNWQISLFAFAIFISIAWLSLQFLNIDRQIAKVAELESKDLESKLFEMSAN
ncbi:MAG: MFS transporter [Bacteroidetes bacterium]|nr:MFS transporter [Bacteroidota bacterium]